MAFMWLTSEMTIARQLKKKFDMEVLYVLVLFSKVVNDVVSSPFKGHASI